MEQLLAGLSSNVAPLLYLFNAARPPASDAEAVRLYYLIWEGLHGTPSSSGTVTPEQRLKFTRDFVSHGQTLTYNRNAIAFIESEIGMRLTAFDPTNAAHVSFVIRQRSAARSLLDGELRNQL